jgi:hypothetical protein
MDHIHQAGRAVANSAVLCGQVAELVPVHAAPLHETPERMTQQIGNQRQIGVAIGGGVGFDLEPSRIEMPDELNVAGVRADVRVARPLETDP